MANANDHAFMRMCPHCSAQQKSNVVGIPYDMDELNLATVFSCKSISCGATWIVCGLCFCHKSKARAAFLRHRRVCTGVITDVVPGEFGVAPSQTEMTRTTTNEVDSQNETNATEKKTKKKNRR